MRTATRAAVVTLVTLIVLWPAASLFAHPQSTTEVAIQLKGDGRAIVEITADRDPLLRKLEVFAGLAAGSASVTHIDALSQTLIEQIHFHAGPSNVRLAWLGAVLIPGDRVVIRLAADVPVSAGSLAWSSSLVFGAYPVLVRRGDVSTPAIWLQGAESTPEIPLATLAPPRGATAVFRYFRLGYTHILPNGFDHILFVLGLFLLNRRPKFVLLQVTAFTIAHSITLALSLYGVVSLPSSIIEPLIALSIAYVAFENLFTSTVKPWRVALVFGFGLLHGLGFAEALSRLALPRSEFLTTLVTFNVGVEAGQLSVIAAATLIVWLLRVSPENYRRRVVWPASAAIAAMGVFWTVTRL